jgi:hypothetical protein
VRLEASLSSLDNLEAEALVLLLPQNPFPLSGLLSLLDWRLAFNFSAWLRKLLAKGEEPSEAAFFVDFYRLKFGRVLVFFCEDNLRAPQKLESQILHVLKILDKANINDFVLAFPDRYQWISEHWKRHYEHHPVFSQIAFFDQYNITL